MERSEIRDFAIACETAPDCASLHPGYKTAMQRGYLRNTAMVRLAKVSRSAITETK
jgi:hypothetical protein